MIMLHAKIFDSLVLCGRCLRPVFYREGSNLTWTKDSFITQSWQRKNNGCQQELRTQPCTLLPLEPFVQFVQRMAHHDGRSTSSGPENHSDNSGVHILKMGTACTYYFLLLLMSIIIIHSCVKHQHSILE